MNPYIGILFLFLVATAFLVFMLTLAVKVGPKARTLTKQLPFECGSVTVGDVNEQRLNVRFYMVTMLFILFDIEVIFMYPWAVVLLDLGWSGYFIMVSFMLVLTVGLAFIWRKGILDWNKAG